MGQFDFDNLQNERSHDHCAQLGTVVSLMLQNARYRRFPLACLVVWTEPAISLKQARLYFDAKGKPVGYLTWALLTSAMCRRIESEPDTLLHISEWNEGTHLWIMDFLALPGYASPIARHARSSLFSQHDVVRWRRRKADDDVRKVACFQRRER